MLLHLISLHALPRCRLQSTSDYRSRLAQTCGLQLVVGLDHVLTTHKTYWNVPEFVCNQTKTVRLFWSTPECDCSHQVGKHSRVSFNETKQGRRVNALILLASTLHKCSDQITKKFTEHGAAYTSPGRSSAPCRLSPCQWLGFECDQRQ